MKFVDELNLQGKRVFLRADLNVPIENGVIQDDHRIQATLPTLEYCLDHGASVVLCSHLGRPEGRQSEFSLGPVAVRLAELLGRTVTLAPDCIGEKSEQLASVLKAGEVLLLENVRFYEEEEKNDSEFAAKLARLADVYVNDAFATAHRKHASTAGITKFFQEKAGGFTLKTELSYFGRAFHNPERPLVAIFGGAKVSTKMAAIKGMGARADRIIIGGAMANTFFVALGYSVGGSLYEPEEVARAAAILEEFGRSKLLLPTDVVVASKLAAGEPTEVRLATEIRAGEMALDIGPMSVKLFREAILLAKTSVWNGPMGAFEVEEFSAGTYGIVDALVDTEALTVVGGGDTDLALTRRDAVEKMSFVSTAGGAFLKLLEGVELPAVKALS